MASVSVFLFPSFLFLVFDTRVKSWSNKVLLTLQERLRNVKRIRNFVLFHGRNHTRGIRGVIHPAPKLIRVRRDVPSARLWCHIHGLSPHNLYLIFTLSE